MNATLGHILFYLPNCPIYIFSGFTKSVSLRSQFMETQAFQDIMQDTSMYDAHSTASSEAGSPFPATGVMSVNSENEMPSIEAAHSTTSSYEDDGKSRTIQYFKYSFKLSYKYIM